MRTTVYDLVVIGAGSGGLATSKRAAAHGAKVAIVEADRVGGTCVIRGCIPKKLMVYAGELGHGLTDASGYGWQAQVSGFDWPVLVEKRDQAIAALERRHEELLKASGVTLLRGRASVVSVNEVAVDGDRLTARFILIATGSSPVLPDIDGVANAITSDDFFELRSQPRRVCIVGGGYIAVELASILRALGTDVVQVIRADLPLRGFDGDLRRESRDALRAAGVDLRCSTAVVAIDEHDGAVRLRLAGEDGLASTLDVEKALLYATGRQPRSRGLGLETAGVRLGPRGEILVDDSDATSVPSIFAVGDVTGRVALTPVAIKAGRLLADRLFGGKSLKMCYDRVPTAVFSDPPIAAVGWSEEDAVTRLGRDRVEVRKAAFTPLLHTLTERRSRTFLKTVIDRETDLVVGCHMIGRDAPEIIQGFAVALNAGATKAHFDATVGVHPSSAEEFVTLT